MSESTAPWPVLLVEDIGPVRRLTMNRPDALNALNGELIEAMSTAVRAASEDDDVRIVILRGAGRAFCAGYDLNEDAEGGEHDARSWHEELSRVDRAHARVHRVLQAHHRAGALLLPGRGHRPDARLRSRGGRRRREVRLRRHPLRFGRRVDVPAVGRRGAPGEGAALHGGGSRERRRGPAHRYGEPRRARRRARPRNAGARERDREERAVRDRDDEAGGEPCVGRRRVPGGDGRQHRARRADRDGEPARA